MQDNAQPTEEINPQLSQICSEEMCNPVELNKIWNNIPDQDEGSDYLERTCISLLGLSDLVDDNFQKIPSNKKLAKKYRLMAKLLSLKAEQLDVDVV